MMFHGNNNDMGMVDGVKMKNVRYGTTLRNKSSMDHPQQLCGERHQNASVDHLAQSKVFGDLGMILDMPHQKSSTWNMNEVW